MMRDEVDVLVDSIRISEFARLELYGSRGTSEPVELVPSAAKLRELAACVGRAVEGCGSPYEWFSYRGVRFTTPTRKTTKTELKNWKKEK